MDEITVETSLLSGHITIPSSKSQTLRAILFGALAEGTSTIEDPLQSPDTSAMIEALRSMGAHVSANENRLVVKGFGGKPKPTEDVIQCGNSGLVLRLIGGVSALSPHYTILTGDESIRHRRCAFPLLSGLRQLGALALSSRGDEFAPLIIKGPMTEKRAYVNGEDSQPISALLIASAFANHPIELTVENPKETPWIDMTLDWFQRLGLQIERRGYSYYRIEGSSHVNSFSTRIAGDFSSAAFPIAAALATDSDLMVHNLTFDDPQGDRAVISLLEKMGAQFEINHEKRTLRVKKGSQLRGMEIDVDPFIDALPILAVIGTFASGKTTLFNGRIARHKESDRIASIVLELKKMGANIEEHEDGLTIYTSDLRGARVDSHLDHRIAMSLAVGAMRASGKSTIQRSSCIEKTYPNFASDLKGLGAKLS